MALTTTQVNAAYVALLGRAAEGNANAWAESSADTKTLANTILSVDGKFKNSLEQAKTNADFVEALYQQVLGRAADADGKAFWLNALANGTSRDELKANFLAAAKANNEDLTAFDTSNQQFLSDVYSALLNRSVDNSGLEHWMNLLNNGTSRAEVVANIIEAINANKASDDYAIYNAKMSVANAVTKVFAGPKAGLNAEQSKALNDQLVSIMSSVTSADVTEESIKAQIENVVGLYGKEAAPLTFKAVTDKLENYELGNADSATAQTFRGTINLQDGTKSTINDKATLKTSNFSDTLVVDVIPSIDGKAFDYSGSQVETFASGDNNIKNLTINNGTAKITNLDNAGITENLKITGAANVSGTVSADLNYLEINTGGNANAKATITVNANLKEYVGKGSGKDDITVSGNNTVTVSTINTGAGDDKLTLNASGAVNRVDLGAGNDEMIVSGAGASIANATINLGAGNDKITLATVVQNGLKGATIDGGAGRDTLIVSGDLSTSGDFTLKNIEVLQASGAGTEKVSYAQIKDQELTLTKDSQGALEIIATANDTTIDLTKLNNKVAAGETALTELKLTDVGSGANSGVTVTLNKDDGIAETIKLANGAAGVTIDGFKSTSDKLNVNGIGATATWTDPKTLEENKLAVIADNQGAITISGDKLGEAANKIITAGGITTDNGLTTGKKTYIAISNSTDTTNLYEITGDATAGLDSGDSVKLIATIKGDALVAGDFAFN